MYGAKLKFWAYGLFILGLMIGAGTGVFSQTEAAPIEPAANHDDDPLPVAQPAPARDEKAEELAAIKKQIEELRQRIAALEMNERNGRQPKSDRRKVEVVRPQSEDVVVTQQFTGKIHSHHHIQVNALQTGIIEATVVKEGQAVKKGDVIFKISPIMQNARLDAENAEVQIAQLELNNTKKLANDKVVSPREVALSEAKLAKALAKARLAEAELRLTSVHAPFDGKVGRMRKQEGTLVREGDAITTLSDNSVMWVYFDVPQARYLEYKRLYGKGHDHSRLELADSRIELLLDDGVKFSESGGNTITVEADFDNKNGNVAFRADFPNPDRLLQHGQSGNVLIHRKLKDAMLIPKEAVWEDRNQSSRFVWVVGKDGVVHQREIVIQDESDGSFIIKKGIDFNDRIIRRVDRPLRDGEKVDYEIIDPA